MREGELLALTAADFNFSIQISSITKNYSLLNGQDLIKKLKTSKSIRIIMISPFLCSIVQTYMNSIYGYTNMTACSLLLNIPFRVTCTEAVKRPAAKNKSSWPTLPVCQAHDKKYNLRKAEIPIHQNLLMNWDFCF